MAGRIKIAEKRDDDLFSLFNEQAAKPFFTHNRPMYSMVERPWDPPTDVYETRDNLVIKMEIAGVSQENIDVLLENDTLRVRGWRQEEAPCQKEHYLLMEIHYGRFERVFLLPHDFVPGKIEASYKNGFLIIMIPKLSKPSPVKIDID